MVPSFFIRFIDESSLQFQICSLLHLFFFKEHPKNKFQISTRFETENTCHSIVVSTIIVSSFWNISLISIPVVSISVVSLDSLSIVRPVVAPIVPFIRIVTWQVHPTWRWRICHSSHVSTGSWIMSFLSEGIIDSNFSSVESHPCACLFCSGGILLIAEIDESKTTTSSSSSIHDQLNLVKNSILDEFLLEIFILCS